jgi:hypothetical protein
LLSDIQEKKEKKKSFDFLLSLFDSLLRYFVPSYNKHLSSI